MAQKRAYAPEEIRLALGVWRALVVAPAETWAARWCCGLVVPLSATEETSIAARNSATVAARSRRGVSHVR